MMAQGGARQEDSAARSDSLPPLVTVRIPAQIRNLYRAEPRVQVRAADIHAVVAALDALYPGMGERLTEPGGVMRRWVNVFVRGEDIRWMQGMETPLREDDEVTIMPSAAGG